MPYTLISAHNSITRVLSSHTTRQDAQKAMDRISGSILAVRSPSGRIISTNLKRTV